MIKKIRNIIIVSFIVMNIFPLKGQDLQLSQYYNISPLMNPAFAGTTYSHRAIFNTRRQWTGLDASYHSYIASFDYNLKKYNSGLGMFMVHDRQGDGSLQTNTLALQYAYAVNLNENTSLRLAVQSSYNQRRLTGVFTFPDQFTGTGFDPNLGGNDVNIPGAANYIDFATGLLVFTPQLWAGYSSFHLNRPDQSLINESNRINRSHYFIGGYKFVLKRTPFTLYSGGKLREELVITPTFQYKMQGKSDQLDLGLYTIYHPVLFGVWYRGLPLKPQETTQFNFNSESLIFLVGIQLDQFSFGYSFDHVINNLSAYAGGSHEINIIFQWRKKNKIKSSKIPKMLPCPSTVPFNNRRND